MNAWRLGMRMLGRDWRAGELNVILAALLLAVASVGTVAFFADRVKGALTREANLLLGADALVSADRPLPDAFVQQAAADGLSTSPALKFMSMVQRAGAPGGPLLADVKAVTGGYPLRGSITVADAVHPEGTRVSGIPAKG